MNVIARRLTNPATRLRATSTVIARRVLPALALAVVLVAGLSAVSLPAEPDAAPTVTAHPDIAIVDTPNATGAFVATASGSPTPTVQWQVSTDRRGPWVDLPGATDTTLPFTASQNTGDPFALGNAFRAVFTNSAGTAVSRPARLAWRAEWMQDLGSDIENVPITELTIPGSHDMGTYGLDFGSLPSGDSNDPCAHLAPIDVTLASLVYIECVEYGKAQSGGSNAATELQQGIRYFDLRACHGAFGGVVTCHGLEGAAVDSILAQTREFVDAHPGELVILDFNHHYDLDLDEEASRIEQAMARSDGTSRLIPPQYCNPGNPAEDICTYQLTLGNIRSRGLGQVIVNFENDESDTDTHPDLDASFYARHPLLWGYWRMASFFGDDSDTDTVRDRVIASLTDPHVTHHNVWIQFLQTTPDGLFIIFHPFGSLSDMANDSNPVIGPAIFNCTDAAHCFAAYRPENVNVLPINFYERTSYGSVNFDLVGEVISFNAYARTAPVVNMSTPFTPAGTGWYNQATLGGTGHALPLDVFTEDYRYPTGITAFDCSDGTAFMPFSPDPSLPSASAQLTLHDGVHLMDCRATDGARLGFHGEGNRGAGPSSTPENRPVIYRVDTTPPTITCPSDNQLLLNQPGATITGVVTDATSGPANGSASAAVATNAVGAFSTTLAASDNAGNTTSVSCPYTVSYRVVVRYDATMTSKSGSVVPIRIALEDYFGADLSDKSIPVTARTVTNVTSNATFPPTSPGATNPGFQFSVSPGAGYQYNLKTTGYGPGPYTLDFVATGDPIVHHAPFQIR